MEVAFCHKIDADSPPHSFFKQDVVRNNYCSAAAFLQRKSNVLKKCQLLIGSSMRQVFSYFSRASCFVAEWGIS